MKTNFVLVDFENIQPNNVGSLSGRSFKIKVFTGASQSKVPLEMARALQALGPDVEYVPIDGNGKNALDFHIAYYIGRLAAENPGSSFYVISKDKGFDPLMKHVKSQGISCQRLISLTDVPGGRVSASKLASISTAAAKTVDPKPIPDKVQVVIGNLTKRKTGKPRNLKTLRSTINALFQKSLSETELDEVIGQLTRRGAITVADGKVQYKLPD